MQDEITSDLARLADLKVVGSQSTGSYVPNKKRDLRAVGRDLGVRYLLEVTSGEPIASWMLRSAGRPSRQRPSWTESHEPPLKTCVRSMTRPVAAATSVSLA
jgi:hypothetical protein